MSRGQELDTTPQHEHRLRISKEKSDSKKNSQVARSYRYIEGGKIKEKITMKNGNKYTRYLGSVKKDPELAHEVKEEQKKRIHL